MSESSERADVTVSAPTSGSGNDGNNGPDGMSRRQLLRHGAWFGAAVALTVNASGGATVKTVVLLTPEEVDAAAKRSVEYRPPGS